MGIIKQAYDRRAVKLQPYEIPDWGITVYVGPMTVNQFSEMDEQADSISKNIAAVQVLAKNEKGERFFNQEDIHEMRSYGDPKLISRIAGELYQLAEKIGREEEKKA